MKANLISAVGLMILTACAGMYKSSRSVSLDEIEKLIYVSKTTKKDMASRFGKPSQTKISPNKEIWYFDDPKTGLERFALQFDRSEKLINVLWMPWPHEPENQLKNVISRYSSSSFEVLRTEEVYHSINTETTYTDNSSMLIWHDDGQKKVQVIGWFLPGVSGTDPKQNGGSGRN